MFPKNGRMDKRAMVIIMDAKKFTKSEFWKYAETRLKSPVAQKLPAIGVRPTERPIPNTRKFITTAPDRDTAARGVAPSWPVITLSAIWTKACPANEKITGKATRIFLL